MAFGPTEERAQKPELCHPERSGRFATRSSHAVEGSASRFHRRISCEQFLPLQLPL